MGWCGVYNGISSESKPEFKEEHFSICFRMTMAGILTQILTDLQLSAPPVSSHSHGCYRPCRCTDHRRLSSHAESSKYVCFHSESHLKMKNCVKFKVSTSTKCCCSLTNVSPDPSNTVWLFLVHTTCGLGIPSASQWRRIIALTLTLRSVKLLRIRGASRATHRTVEQDCIKSYRDNLKKIKPFIISYQIS